MKHESAISRGSGDVVTRRHRLADLDAVLAYSAAATERETQKKGGIPPAFVWYWQSLFYRDAKCEEETLACLERANACDSSQFAIRHDLAKALEAAGRFAEAEPHFRWCVARKPQYSSLTYALVKVTKQRLARRELVHLEGAVAERAEQRRGERRRGPPHRDVVLGCAHDGRRNAVRDL